MIEIEQSSDAQFGLRDSSVEGAGSKFNITTKDKQYLGEYEESLQPGDVILIESHDIEDGVGLKLRSDETKLNNNN